MSSKKKKAKKLAKKMAKKAAKKNMKPKKKQVRKMDTWKKKEWYTVVAPKMFDEKPLLETPALKPTKLANRIVRVPLRDLTNKIQHQTTSMRFKVTEVKGRTAYTESIGFEILRDALRRNIRRRRSIIKTILNLQTKDKKKIRMTSYIFTARKIDTLKQKALRKIMDDHLKTEIPKIGYNKLLEKSIYGELASEVYKLIKKIQRIKRVEITKITLIV